MTLAIQAKGVGSRRLVAKNGGRLVPGLTVRFNQAPKISIPLPKARPSLNAPGILVAKAIIGKNTNAGVGKAKAGGKSVKKGLRLADVSTQRFMLRQNNNDVTNDIKLIFNDVTDGLHCTRITFSRF